MKKIKIFGTLGILGLLGLSLCAVSMYENSKNSNVNRVDVNWLDGYPGYEDYCKGEDDSDNLRNVLSFTDQECIDNLYGTKYKGRWVKVEQYETDDLGVVLGKVSEHFMEYYPTKIERKTIKAIKEGEKDTNEWCDVLVQFLTDYVNSKTGSYESFSSYMDYLVDDFGMYEEEKEEWLYDWRFAHDSLTDEDKAKLEAIEQERIEAEKEREEANDKVIEDLFDIQDANKDNHLSLYQREAQMLTRNTPDYYHFDAEKYINLREQGYSYLDAYNQSIDINLEEGMGHIGDKMNDNKDWYKENIEILTSDSFQETLNNIGENFGGFLGELFGNLETDTEGDSE